MYKEVKLYNHCDQSCLLQDSETDRIIELWVCDEEEGIQQPPLYLTKDEAIKLARELVSFAEGIVYG